MKLPPASFLTRAFALAAAAGAALMLAGVVGGCRRGAEKPAAPAVRMVSRRWSGLVTASPRWPG